ncbi:ribosome biogenesis protein tsr1 [Lentinula aciculospora]|uniref:Ribosome biogenesis protein tsr1 n=1 Tax=Lentinula aciculospora TaxID=153920 RepID=A0A9W9AJ38_9AGAR|nr:ribosome biogenesis protein tsr1 [Lentinula aciculospora]KAJ4490867.1 ribosome biogenesis protein tsr1 [Lentinula aciculospora]
MVAQQHHHRPTLKQSNKSFKSKHASKGSLKDAQKGKAPRSSPKLHSTTSHDSAQLRLNRRNAAKQAQSAKRQSTVDSRRLFNSGAPRIVAVVSLTSDINPKSCVEQLASVLRENIEGEGETTSKLNASRFRTSLQFLFPNTFYSILDALLIADYVLLVLSPSVEVDERGETLMRTMQSVGMPSVVAVAGESTQETTPKTPKEHKEILKSLLSFTQYFVPSLTRVYDLSSSPSEVLNTIRALCESTPAEVKWRVGRSYLLADQLTWVDSTVGTKETPQGSLSVTGIIRGASLDPNRLVHLPGWGDYQVEKILSAPLPHPARNTFTNSPNAIGQDDTVVDLLAEPTPSEADSLVSTNPTDVEEELQREQTWPTDEEMRGINQDSGIDIEGQEPIPDALTGTTPKRIKRLPKGMSEYQAAWIVDSDSEGDDGENDEDVESDVAEKADVAMDEDELEGDNSSSRGGKRKVRFGDDFEDLPQDEEEIQLASWRLAREKEKEREKEEQTHALFPDELDTPLNIPAQQRFARYRGLRSFRTSPWDPYENLPREYGRIFSWEGQGDKRGGGAFRRMERSVMKRVEKDGGGGVEPGIRVTVVLKNVSQNVYLQYVSSSPTSLSISSSLSSPLTLFALQPHEHKQTVLNFTVTRNTEYTAYVRSKDPMILCLGFRRLQVKPVYSAFEGGETLYSRKIPPNNVHKFFRYLPHSGTSMATIYGPVMLGSGRVSCVLLKDAEIAAAATSTTLSLVASGTLAAPSTTRIIAKRVVLTGHPFKVHKKTATVRYMFFNADDVNYFSPIQLHTKHGRTGHIKESLGTHGYFKAHFDGPVSQMDTVCMSLYKRVWPRWSKAVQAVEDSVALSERQGIIEETVEMREDVDMN